jgi:hypothetical protein
MNTASLIDFPQRNVIYAENQPEYLPLPAYKIPDDPEGRIIFCWKLSFRDRLRVLFTGKLWHSVLTFNHSLQPQVLMAESPFLEQTNAG